MGYLLYNTPTLGENVTIHLLASQTLRYDHNHVNKILCNSHRIDNRTKFKGGIIQGYHISISLVPQFLSLHMPAINAEETYIL